MFGKLFGKKPKDEAPKESPPPPPSKATAQPAKSDGPPPGSRAPLAPIDPPRNAAPTPAKDAFANLTAQTQQGAAALADEAGLVERAIRAGLNHRGAPLAPDAQRALRRAAESLVSAGDELAKTAVLEIKAGRLAEAFRALREDAEASGPAKADRLRRLGALAFLVDAGQSLAAYQDAWDLDQRDFWHAIFLARLQGLGGRLDLSLASATIAAKNAHNAQERSQAEAELTLIALGQGDEAGATRHAEAAVEALRGTDASFDLAQRWSLRGDVAVMVSDAPGAAKAYRESFDLIAKLGAHNPSDINLARASADTQEKLAAVMGRQNQNADALTTCSQAVDLRRRLHAAQPGEALDIIALAAALNTLGELKRIAQDSAGAQTNFKEAVDIGRKAVAAAPSVAAAHREVWVGLWRLAQLPNSGTPWSSVVAALQDAQLKGGLLDRDVKFLNEARARAGA